MPSKVSFQVRQLGVRPLWDTTRGKGVRVAVLDSGVSTSEALPQERVEALAADGAEQRPPTDPHGTRCASLIASGLARGEGIAPEADLLGIQVCAASGAPLLPLVKLGFQLALAKECDVISCSFVLEQVDDELHQLVRQAHLAGVPVIAAAGNIAQPALPPLFPEAVQNAIVVSALDVDNVPLPMRVTTFTDIFALGQNLHVVEGDGLVTTWDGATSGAAAITSGVVALALSLVTPQKRRRVGTLIDGLLKSSATRSPSPDGSGLPELLRINPARLLEQVQQLT
jgi:subtilisin family serine protease